MPTETHLMRQCLNRRCPVHYWPAEAGDQCPCCRLTGVYAGIAAMDTPTTPVEEEQDG